MTLRVIGGAFLRQYRGKKDDEQDSGRLLGLWKRKEKKIKDNGSGRTRIRNFIKDAIARQKGWIKENKKNLRS